MNSPSDNNTEKIFVTADEVARIDIGSGEAAPSITLAPAPAPAAHAAGPLRSRLPIIAFAASVAVLILVVGVVLVSVFLRLGQDNVDEFARRWRAQHMQELTQSPDVKAYIESTHPLVTFKGATVDSVDVTTRDGSRRAGRNGSNVSEIDFVVTYFWHGPVQDNGHTTVRHLFDFPSKQMKNSKIIETTALVTIDDESLTQLGMFLIPLLLGGN